VIWSCPACGSEDVEYEIAVVVHQAPDASPTDPAETRGDGSCFYCPDCRNNNEDNPDYLYAMPVDTDETRAARRRAARAVLLDEPAPTREPAPTPAREPARTTLPWASMTNREDRIAAEGAVCVTHVCLLGDVAPRAHYWCPDCGSDDVTLNVWVRANGPGPITLAEIDGKVTDEFCCFFCCWTCRENVYRLYRTVDPPAPSPEPALTTEDTDEARAARRRAARAALAG